MTSVPDITRLLARIHEWQEGHDKPEVAPKPRAGSLRHAKLQTPARQRSVQIGPHRPDTECR